MRCGGLIVRIGANQLVVVQIQGEPELGRLKLIVPSIGQFFTHLQLQEAFGIQDDKRNISKRMFVSPSFNDVRLILNTAQVLSLARAEEPLKLATFDGDVTLYDDGMSLDSENPIIPRLLRLLSHNVAVALVTAAGYPDKDGHHYYRRLGGLIEAVSACSYLSEEQKSRLLIMGGESNYLFQLSTEKQYEPTGLKFIDPSEWMLSEMENWSQSSKIKLLDTAQSVMEECVSSMNLPAHIIRKQHGVGLVPKPGKRMCREELEEVVLSCNRALVISPDTDHSIKFCAFNGGSDVWVDVGDKNLGVTCIRRYLGGIPAEKSLHVGDQFASIIANDYRARMAACTVWIASPQETVDIMDELIEYTERAKSEAY